MVKNSQHKLPKVLSFGCRLNTYESEVMRAHAIKNNRTDLIIVNTCAVTKEAERQCKQSLRKLHREHPGSEIIATGCAVQLNPSSYLKIPGVTKILGNNEKLRPENFSARAHSKSEISDIMIAKETASHLVKGFHHRTRAFVQIQQGCDHRCTFCIIPFARGNNRSVPMGALFKEIKNIVKAGHQEVILTGVDITGYGTDLPGQPTLGQMIKRLLTEIPELPRLRLSSLDPAEIDPDLYNVIATNKRLLPHFHISVQSGDNLILKRMKRRHNREQVIDFCNRIKTIRPESVFGADIIAGFPTETDAQFYNSLSLIKEAKLGHLHVFPYSIRNGTPAARMPQVPSTIIKERAALLRDAGKKEMAKILNDCIGKKTCVLMESEFTGNNEQYLPVRVEHSAQSGTLLDLKIKAVSNGQLVAA